MEEIIATEAEVEEIDAAESEEVELVESETSEADTSEAAPSSINDLKPKMELHGIVTRLELYGAFIDIGVGPNALIHISKLGKDQVNRVSDALNVGDEVRVWVEKVNPEQSQIMVSMVEPLAVEWNDLSKGQVYSGAVSRLEKYGAFVDIGAEREGLVHISELSHDYVKHPSEILSIGDEVQVQVLDFSKRKRRIDLSIKNLQEKPQDAAAAISDTSVSEDVDDFEEEMEEVPTAMEIALRRAMGDDSIDALEAQSKRKRKKGRGKQRKRRDQDDLLDRTLHYQKEG